MSLPVGGGSGRGRPGPGYDSRMAVRESRSANGTTGGGAGPGAEAPRDWTFLTNHARVLMCIAADPDVRLRDVAASVGITERATQHIVQQLEEAGYLERERVGRRNRYQLHADRPLRHPMDREHAISELLNLLGAATPGTKGQRRRA